MFQKRPKKFDKTLPYSLALTIHSLRYRIKNSFNPFYNNGFNSKLGKIIFQLRKRDFDNDPKIIKNPKSIPFFHRVKLIGSDLLLFVFIPYSLHSIFIAMRTCMHAALKVLHELTINHKCQIRLSSVFNVPKETIIIGLIKFLPIVYL